MDLKKEIMDDIEKAQLSAEEILRKYDKESDKRELTGVWNTIINAICIVFCIFQVYTAAFIWPLALHWYFCFTRCASPGRARK